MEERKLNTDNYKNRSKVVSLEKGRIPPQSIELEEAVLGALLLDGKAASEVLDILKADVFYSMAHQLIFESIISLFENSEPIDILTVSTNLKENGKLEKAGGDYYLIQLSQKVASSAHIEIHSRIILQNWVKRESIRVSSNIIEESYDETKDIFDLLANSQRDIDSVSQWLIKKKPVDFKNIVDSIFTESEKENGLPSKLSDVQVHTNGWTEPDLIIVAARPGMGKTAYMLNEAKHLAKLGIPVGIFSLEMSAKQLTERMFAEECSIDAKIVKNKSKWSDFQRKELHKYRAEFAKLPIYIHDQAGLTPMEMKLQSGKWKRENGVKMVFVDYLQLMTASGKNANGNREQEISYISRSLKGIAKELEIPVMALSQLSRVCEQRGGMKRPILSDLRESGAIEQDADIVIFILRPEYYKIDEWDDDTHSLTANQCEIIFAKHRGGETFSVVVSVKLQYMRFENLIGDEPWIPGPLPNQKPEQAFGLDPESNVREDELEDFPF